MLKKENLFLNITGEGFKVEIKDFFKVVIHLVLLHLKVQLLKV